MFYNVKARYIPSAAPEFYRKLTDGTIMQQKPDGAEIVGSMQRARVTPDGFVQWSEKCYCQTPLAHERSTVHDKYFIDLETEEVDGYVSFEGKPFMDVLAEEASKIGD